jgi:hypothetical protein
MKAQIIHDAHGTILGVINLPHLSPAREGALTSRTRRNTPLHTMRVNTKGAHAVLEPIGKSKPK